MTEPLSSHTNQEIAYNLDPGLLHLYTGMHTIEKDTIFAFLSKDLLPLEIVTYSAYGHTESHFYTLSAKKLYWRIVCRKPPTMLLPAVNVKLEKQTGVQISEDTAGVLFYYCPTPIGNWEVIFLGEVTFIVGRFKTGKSLESHSEVDRAVAQGKMLGHFILPGNVHSLHS